MDVSETFRRQKGAEESMKSILKDTLSLVLITLVAALCLAAVYQVTKGPIAEAEENERMDSFRAVFPEATSFEEIGEQTIAEWNAAHPGAEIRAGFEAKDASGACIGAVLSAVSHNGYGGDVVLSVGVDRAGNLTGVKVTEMSESAGLGSHCQDENWIRQFSGKSAGIKFVKDGNPGENEIDAITGATVTTKAVLEAVNQGAAFAADYLKEAA